MTTVLISTIKNERDLIKRMNIKGNCVVVNQMSNHNEINRHTINEDKECIWIESTEKGLSRSRNQAIEFSNASISILADDDLTYRDDYEKIISNAYKENPQYDVIVFKVDSKGFHFKNYSSKKRRLGYLSSMKVSSVQITFRTNVIRDNIKFNKDFGSGSKFLMGEENIFLFDCIRKGLKVLYVPETIAELEQGESTWFSGYNEKYLIDRGASFYAMSPVLHPLLIVQFAIRKRDKFKKNKIGISKSIRLMRQGKTIYKNRQRDITFNS